MFRRGLDIESSREQPEDYLIPLLRMAIKYEFSGVQSQIVSYFKDTWLNNLNNWDIYAAKIRALSGESYSNIPDFNLPEPASAIVIARLFNIPAILPAAFYDLSTISPLNDWEVKYDDDEDEDGEKEIGERSARWRWLKQADLFRLLRGKESLANATREFSESKVLLSPGRCDGPGLRCSDARRALQTKIYDHDGPQDILRHLKSLKDRLRDTACLPCRGRIESKIEEKREDIWDSLTDIFDLSDETRTDHSYDWILVTE